MTQSPLPYTIRRHPRLSARWALWIGATRKAESFPSLDAAHHAARVLASVWPAPIHLET